MKWLMSWMLLCLLSGCDGRTLLPYAREMGETALMRTVGLDIREGEVLMTAAGEGELSLSGAGESLPAAARVVQSLGDSYVYYGHVDQMLVGESWAAHGMEETMDYLAREPQFAPGVQLWVVYGGTAEQAIQKTERVSRRLARLNADGEPGAGNVGCSAARLMSVLARNGSVCVPALDLVAAREDDGGGDGKTLVPDGYAVLRQGRLVCRTDTEVSRGIELMEGKCGGNVVALALGDGTKVSLVTEGARAVCRPVFRDEELVGLDVTCRVNARVAQIGRRLTERELDFLTQRLEQRLGEWILRAVELSQYWDADFLDLERRARLACPGKVEALQRQWPAAFRGLELRVEVLGKVERTGGMLDVG